MVLEQSPNVRLFGVAIFLGACASPRNATLKSAPEGNDASAPLGSSGEPSSCVIPPHQTRGTATSEGANVLSGALATCSTHPMTGVYRDGRCATGADDAGVHVVCAEMTERFLRFTVEHGNDLVSPAGGFPGLRPGDHWCLCAARWAEADAAGVAPPVVLEASHEKALETIALDRLRAKTATNTQ